MGFISRFISRKEGLQDNEMVCTKCLIRDGFFVGGGSHAPDLCPNCNGYETTLVKNLSILNRIKANKLHKHMWQKIRVEKEVYPDEYCKKYMLGK